jgi:hypothetical protein
VATRHTYASTDDLRDYLAGTSYSSGWTADGGSIRRILEAASTRIDQYTSGGAFGPVTETRYYDIGAGSLIDSPQYYVTSGHSDIAMAESLANVIPLDGWLVSTTTVTAYDDTDRGTSTTLTEGYANVGSATSLGPAQTLLVDSEQMYITSISGNTLTVERGVNGTTAATHSGGATVYAYDYPALVVQACLDVAKLTFRNRDLGLSTTIGTGEQSITAAEGEIRSVLMTLDDYRATGTSNGVIF